MGDSQVQQEGQDCVGCQDSEGLCDLEQGSLGSQERLACQEREKYCFSVDWRLTQESQNLGELQEELRGSEEYLHLVESRVR